MQAGMHRHQHAHNQVATAGQVRIFEGGDYELLLLLLTEASLLRLIHRIHMGKMSLHTRWASNGAEDPSDEGKMKTSHWGGICNPSQHRPREFERRRRDMDRTVSSSYPPSIPCWYLPPPSAVPSPSVPYCSSPPLLPFLVSSSSLSGSGKHSWPP